MASGNAPDFKPATLADCKTRGFFFGRSLGGLRNLRSPPSPLRRDNLRVACRAGPAFAAAPLRRGILRVACRTGPASAASQLRRGILRPLNFAWFTEPKLAEGERRMVDLIFACAGLD